MLKGLIHTTASADLMEKVDNNEPIFVSGRLLAKLMLGKDNEGLISRREYLQYFSNFFIETGKNLIADGQSGFGNEMAVWQTAYELGNAGANYLVINDQIWPSTSIKIAETVSETDFINRIRAAVDGGEEFELKIIPKLEGFDTYGYEGLVYRIQLLLKAGIKQILVSRLDLESLKKIRNEQFFSKLGFEISDSKIIYQEVKDYGFAFLIPTVPTINLIDQCENKMLQL